MKNKTYILNNRQRIFVMFLIVSVLTGISFLINYTTLAGSGKDSSPSRKDNTAPASFTAAVDSAPAVNIGERTSVWLKLQPGKSPGTTFYGNDRAISVLQSKLAEPLSQVSSDFNADGYADLIGGFRSEAGGGLIIMHRANKEAFAPQDEQILADLRNAVFPTAFDKEAFVTEVPTAPDFMITGKFTPDSAADLVFASRGGRVIYLLTSDNKGGFSRLQEIAVGGEITALASRRLDYGGPFDGIVVAVTNEKSASLLVFSSGKDLMNTAPRIIPVESEISSIVLSQREASSPNGKLFGLSNGKLFTVSGIGGESRLKMNSIELPYRVVDFAVGNFIADRRARNEIAVLTENGSVNYLTDGPINTNPLSIEDVEEHLKKYGRQSISVKPDNSPDNWTESESYQLGVYTAQNNASGSLQKAYLSGYETEDLIIVDRQAKRVEVLFKEPNRDENRSSFTGDSKTQTVNFARVPVTILPMRLNVMGQQGFVVYDQGSIEPTTVMLAPNANFNVSKTADTNDGTCNADCSIREAVVASNNAAGSDLITVPNNTYTLTRTGIENAAVNGDLDILDAVSIVGSGAAGTIIQAGTSALNGIDKIYSVNPNLLTNLSFATSMTNMTMRFGRSSEGVGGAMDWDAGSTGTITLDNVTATGNSVTGFAGGGAFLLSNVNNPGAGSATITNSTISNNTTDGNGGGLVIQNHPFSMTNVVVSGNSSTLPGGGLFIDGVISATNPGSSTFTGVSFTGNSVTGATRDGGGINTLRGLVFNAPTIINSNSATRWGGGIFMDVSASSVNLNKVTMVGNSATTNGGAVTVGSKTTNTLNMSFSRIVGNTSGGTIKGLSLRGGTANATNNWWGCNTGPSAAPCDTVGVDNSGGAPGGTLNFNPWLRLTHTASPNPIVFGQSTTLTASFLTNSAGTAIAASNLDVLIGLPITFNNAVRGTISNAQTTIQSNGTATATFTSNAVGAGAANATVDNGTATASITINQSATTTTVTSNVNPSVFGQTVTFTATVGVTSPGSGTPTGTIQFRDNGVAIVGCTSVAVAGGQAQCSTSSLSVGTHPITAVYSGDTNFSGSTSATLTQIVARAGTTTTITTDNPDPSVVGQTVTVTYTVTVNNPGAGTPTGNVTVSDGVNSCTGTVAAGQCTVVLTTVGTRTLTATYAGDTNFSGSSDNEPHTVIKANTTTTITADTPDPSTVNQPVTVSYTVAGNTSGAGTPTGNVTVSDGVNSCTGTVAAGQCNITLTTVGARTLTAAYAGDTNFNGSVSAGEPHTVLPLTAANVSVSGRVVTQNGAGISGAVVALLKSSGEIINTVTNQSGYFHFADIESGQFYVVSVTHEAHVFPSQVINVNADLTNLIFRANN